MILSTHVKYINLDTNLNTYNLKKTSVLSNKSISIRLCLLLFAAVLCEFEKEQIILFISQSYPNFLNNTVEKLLKICKPTRSVISASLIVYIFSISFSPIEGILCLFIFQIWCCSYIKKLNDWLPIFLILISNDIHVNPGPHYRENFFNFMSWNLNSLAKKNF